MDIISLHKQAQFQGGIRSKDLSNITVLYLVSHIDIVFLYFIRLLIIYLFLHCDADRSPVN